MRLGLLRWGAVVADQTDYDVVIVGGGIAGSALAVALSGSGLRLALVEARAPALDALPSGHAVGDFDARVSALTPKSVQLLERLSVWDEISDYRCCPYHHMTVWDAEGTGEIEFDAAEVDSPWLGTIVENRAVTRALLQQVSARPDIQLIAPARLEACHVSAEGVAALTLDQNRQLSASLLVAADGALSPVRELMGFATREWDYGHKAIVTTVATSKSHADTAWQRFMPTGPLALLPLPGEASEHRCSIVWSADIEVADEIMALDDGAFCAELSRAAEFRLGTVTACAPRFAFPLRQRHAIDYVQAGVALVGDAAHTIHPLAGQGINLGLADVAALASELTDAKARGISPGDLAVLKRYQRQRKGENLAMMAAMDGFKRLFEQRSPAVRWLRNAGMRGVGGLLPVKQQLMRHAMGLGVSGA